MPVSPRNKDDFSDIATLDSNNPSGELLLFKTQVKSPVMTNYATESVSQVEERDETPKTDFDKWLLAKTDSEDLSLYFDNSEDETDASEPIISSTADERDGVAPPPVFESEEGKQELKETLATLGIGLDGEDAATKDEEQHISSVEEKVDERSTGASCTDLKSEKKTLTSEVSLNAQDTESSNETTSSEDSAKDSTTIPDERSTDASSTELKPEKETLTSEVSSSAQDTDSSNETTSSEGSTKVATPEFSTPNELPCSTSEEDVSTPSDLQIQTMIEQLENSKNLAEADASIKSLDMALDNRVVSDKAARIHIAETITKLDGNRIIMEAIEKWQVQSIEVADVATCLLVALTQVIPEASKAIAQIGLNDIIKTGKAQPENYFLRGNILALLLNLSTLDDETTKQAVCSDACIDVVVQTMQKWPDKAYIQKCGAGYFVRINKIQAEQKDMVKVDEEQAKEPEREAPVVVATDVPQVDQDGKPPKSQEAKPSAPEHYNSPPSEEEVAKMLRRLRDSKDGECAGEAVKVLVRATDSRFIKTAADRKKVSERIVRMNGVAAIILALEKWFARSQKFAYYALTLLVSISKFAAGSRQAIATIGCKTVLDTAGRYADDFYIRGNVLFLLQNLANHRTPATKYEVAESDCIDCVVDTMQRWPDDAHIQHCGCDYFARIVNINGMPTKLHAREIDVLLLGVMDTFQHKQGDHEAICTRAKIVMDKIHQDG